MKKLINYCSLFCAAAAVIMLIFGIRALTGHGFLVGLRIFNIVQSGSVMGVIGNFVGMVISCWGFGSMAFYGLGKSAAAKKKGFLWGAFMTAVCVISCIVALISGAFTVGDLIIAALPAVYTFGMLKSA